MPSSAKKAKLDRRPSRFALEASHSNVSQPTPSQGGDDADPPSRATPTPSPPSRSFDLPSGPSFPIPTAGELSIAVSSVENGANLPAQPDLTVKGGAVRGASRATSVGPESPPPQMGARDELRQALLGPGERDEEAGLPSSSSSEAALEKEEGMWAEVRRLSKLAGPLMIQNVLGYSQAVISVAFLGHVGEAALGAGVLATSFYNITGLSIIIGLTSGLETLCGQAYGAGQASLLGVFLQRAVLVALLATVPIAALWYNSGRILVLLGQDATLASMAGQYLWSLFPGLLCVCFSEGIRRFLMSQGVVKPTMFVAALVTALSLPLNYLLIHKLGWGMMGAAATVVLCNVLTLTFLVGYLKTVGRETFRRCWTGLSPKAATSDLGAYLRIALPATLMLTIEWWLFEIVILMSGWLPNPKVTMSTMGIAFQCTSLAYMVPMSIGSALTTRIGNELGANRPDRARLASRTGFIAVLFVQAFIISSMLAFRHQLPLLFTKGPEVIALTAATLIPLSFSLCGDAINCVLNAVIRGSGRQDMGAKIGLTTWWGFGLPMAYFIGFTMGKGVVGIWVALALTTTLQALVMGVFLASPKFTFDREAERAQTRIANASGTVGSS